MDVGARTCRLKVVASRANVVEEKSERDWRTLTKLIQAIPNTESCVVHTFG
jgi:hypothetical protein